MIKEVPLDRRQVDYRAALERAEAASENYLTARAGGAIPQPVTEEMDSAQAELRRAKRRLEETERRLERRAGGSVRRLA